MAAYWDFRKILDVDPDGDRTCVGIAKTYGRRCKNPISVPDRNTASRLLSQMDRSKSYTRAEEDIQKLAALMLCKGVHNCQSRPHLSQVNEVYRDWLSLAEEEYVHVQKQRDRAARLRTQRELAQLRDSARDEVERNAEERVYIS